MQRPVVRFEAKIMGGISYIVLKFAAYVGWCIFGIKLFDAARPKRAPLGFAYGALRLLMGFGFGILIWLIGSQVYTKLSDVPARGVFTYLTVYVPVRWVEWSLMAVIIAPDRATCKSLVIGNDNTTRAWRLGGIGISCLADIPMIISLGGILPVGRFMC